MKKYEINPFPPSWCRNVDFLPTMFLQAKVNQDQEIYYFKGHVSTSGSTPTEPIITDLGVSIKPSTTQLNRVDIGYGRLEPNADEKISNKEIWNTFKEQMPDQPDIVVGQRGTIHTVPENVMTKEPFDGADYIFQQQTSIGNRSRSIRQKTGIPVTSSYSIARNGLYSHEIVKPGDPCLSRIKGTLTTDFIIPSNNNGYGVLQDIILDVERGLRGKVQGRAKGRCWWEDTAIPSYVRGNYDHTAIDIRICILDDYKKLIGV